MNTLAEIYHSPGDPGSLGGAERLFRRAKELHIPGVTRQSVREYLKGEQAYTLHRPRRRHFERNPTYVAGIDAQWQADLCDMQALSRQNGGDRYILTVIDIFSKYAWAVPVKRKDAADVAAAFSEVLRKSAPRQPRRLQTDKGKEFFNKDFSALMNRHGIQHFASESDQKAAVVERFNRTIKTRLWTYMSDRGTVRWNDVLQQLVDAYNQSPHRSIGMRPSEVEKKDEARLWVRLYGDGDTQRKAAAGAISDGAKVRISSVKGVFEKGYMPNWSKEHFLVAPLPPKHKGSRRPLYKLKDSANEELKGSWYREELQLISNNQYRIEKVLQRRTLADGTKERLVHWEGWPDKFNTWVKESDLYNVAT